MESVQPTEFKYCARCEKDLPIDSFGVQRNLPSGRNYYCKECNRLRTRRAREKQRASTQKRKPCVISPAAKIRKRTKKKVCAAIREGYGTRRQLKRRTRLDWDSLGDALAVLKYDEGIITSRVIGGEAVFLLKQTA